MIYVISDVVENIISEMTKSDHFSLMLDETSVVEQLAIHGRYI